MSINKSYAVFGLGRYGRAVVKELLNNGATVIAVDKNPKCLDLAEEKLQDFYKSDKGIGEKDKSCYVSAFF